MKVLKSRKVKHSVSWSKTNQEEVNVGQGNREYAKSANDPKGKLILNSLGKLFFLVGSFSIRIDNLLPDRREDAKDKADCVSVR